MTIPLCCMKQPRNTRDMYSSTKVAIAFRLINMISVTPIYIYRKDPWVGILPRSTVSSQTGIGIGARDFLRQQGNVARLWELFGSNNLANTSSAQDRCLCCVKVCDLLDQEGDSVFYSIKAGWRLLHSDDHNPKQRWGRNLNSAGIWGEE